MKTGGPQGKLAYSRLDCVTSRIRAFAFRCVVLGGRDGSIPLVAGGGLPHGSNHVVSELNAQQQPQVATNSSQPWIVIELLTST